MKKLDLRTKLTNEFIEIPVAFIDEYMPEAPSDTLKVYLYLLRASTDPTIFLSLGDLADLFDVTPNRISQALCYWEERGLLTLSYTDDEITGVVLDPIGKKSEPVPASPPISAPQPAPAEEPKTLSEEEPIIDFQALSEDDSFTELLSIAECYLKRPIAPVQHQALGEIYCILGRRSDLADYLLQYCIGNGHSSLHYMKAVAKAWQEAGYTTVKEAREATSSRNKNTYSIMNAFGIKNRDPVKSESDYILSWVKDFDLPVILEAANRTMANLHTPDFHYANAILNRWKSDGVRAIQDIAALDARYDQQKKAAPAPAPKNNGFHNFDQRNTDYDALFRQYTK